ncbi:MAG: HAMP domain-containing protein [Myxococcales bacterium]|nr:HAMP domain-containing protein [Myxococcales bacterium]
MRFFRLQTKLTLAFLFVTIVPLSVTIGLLFQRIKQEFEADFNIRLGEIKRSIAAVYALEEKAILRKLKSVKGEPAIHALLLDLGAGVYQKRNDEAIEKQRALIRDTQRMMRAMSLDVLKLLDAKGRPLAYGHQESFSMVVDATSLRYAKRFAGQTFLRYEWMWKNSKRERRLTLQVATRLQRSLLAVGGVLVNRDLLRSLRAVGTGTELVLFAKDGHVLMATTTNPASLQRADAYKREEITLTNPGSTVPLARLAVYLSKADLQRNSDQLLLLAVILGAIGFVLSIGLAAVFSRAIARPVNELAKAAGQIAGGNWNVQLERAGRDEIGELVRAFNSMGSELERYETELRQAERIAAWKDIARQIAHEIKNPLFPIQTCIETLKKAHDRRHRDFDEILDESTATVLEEVKRLKQIVDEFSNFARMPKPELKPIGLNQVLEHVAILYRNVSESIVVELDLGRDLEPIDGDASLLQQAFINLVKNAIDAVDPANGRVSIRSYQHGDWIVAEVSDNGHGIAAEDTSRVFQPYFSQKAHGTGLGLAIVHRVVTDHGGQIEVESELGRGTTFRLRFRPSGLLSPDVPEIY